ncbi:gluconate 5-dehydrogenase [Neofusicoccum parvum]|uniref:Gluconate 5-dehydrogenase n=1 Tax=Neofusicoccum parvum TaxID=310453 RepID=A0ACB5RXM4_9PEZI|nr:gluconate 5-dehydrogenase [Neofusicoccum parvum]
MAGANLLDFQNIFSLEGKVAVVTGGSRGLGLAAASGILQAGASKVYITSRTASACEQACTTLNALPNKRPGAEAISVPADSSTTDGIQGLVDAVSQTTDHVDLLLVNAGTAHREGFDTHNEEKWDEVLNINLKSVFYTIQRYSPPSHIPQRHTNTHHPASRRFTPLLTHPSHATLTTPSRAIVTASVSAIGQTTLGANAAFSYAAAKAGAVHLVRQLALELGPRHVLVNSIAPGFFPTEMAAPMIEARGGAAELGRTYPNGRLGAGEDFAAAVVWLGSRAGSHVVGQCIVVDGGGVIGKINKE